MKRRAFNKMAFSLPAASLCRLFDDGGVKEVAILEHDKDECRHVTHEMPDVIVGIAGYQDRIILACKHSVWELYQECPGQWQRVLIMRV